MLHLAKPFSVTIKAEITKTFMLKYVIPSSNFSKYLKVV